MGSVSCCRSEEDMQAVVERPSTSNAAKAWAAPIEAAIARLKELNINFLAIDFDCTILDIHTGGRWTGTMEELLPHVRPFFPLLIQAALESHIHVAIVTFSSQMDLVRGILELTVGIELAHKIPIRAGGLFSYNGVGIREGKQAHMASAAEELECSAGSEISKHTTLLIDDDVKNVQTALRDGVRAIWLNPDRAQVLLKDMAQLV